MKRFLCLMGLAFALATMTYAAPPYTGQEVSDQVQVVLTDAQQTVDFVFVATPEVVYTIATTAGTEYTFYQAQPMEVRAQVFNLEMPVFRLYTHRMKAFKSNLYTGWRGHNSNPPSQYDRA